MKMIWEAVGDAANKTNAFLAGEHKSQRTSAQRVHRAFRLIGESLLVTFKNLAEGPTAQFLDDLEAPLQDLLILLQHAAFRFLFKLSL